MGTDAVDGIAPKTVVRPGTPTTKSPVSSATQTTQRLAVIPLGGRLHHLSLGNLPERYDLALDVTRLNQVVEFEPADLTITVPGRDHPRRAASAAAEANMMVPFDPSLPDGATVGGVLAGALSGPARMSFGAPRDFTIGMRVVTRTAD